MYLFRGISNELDSPKREFFGCTLERLFQIQDGIVRSEALAGTRPRGSTQEDLFTSPKDQEENVTTGRYIHRNFLELHYNGLLEDRESITGTTRK